MTNLQHTTGPDFNLDGHVLPDQGKTTEIPDSEGESELDGLLFQVLLAIGSHVGDDFFVRLTQQLSAVTDMRIAFIAELDLDQGRDVAVTIDGLNVAPVRFLLPNTPCEEVVETGVATYARGVSEQFPTDDLLVQSQGEAFVGVALRSAGGDPIGILGLVHNEPISNSLLVQSLLQMLAPRVAAELGRRQHEVALNRSESLFRLLAESSQDLQFFYQLLPSPRLQYLSPAVERMFGKPAEAFLATNEFPPGMIHADDRKTLGAAMDTGTESPIAVRVPGEPERWFEFRNFYVRNERDEITAVGGSVREIQV